jgi:membrane protease YdiL (CAAX protease family)
MTALQADIEPSPPSYRLVSRGPLASLVFVGPLLAAYEWGVLQLGAHAVRNGADLWLRGLLDVLGFGQYFLLPTLTVLLLLSWHHLSGEAWRLPWRVLPGMAVESVGLALCLVAIAHLQGAMCQTLGLPPTMTVGRHTAPGVESRLLAFLGAGIYEEVLFRLMLLPACVFALSWLGLPSRKSLLIGIASTSLVFALAHYVGPHGEPWQAFSFLFRIAAGAFFAVLFIYRGFGITAGAHAGYDILVGLS